MLMRPKPCQNRKLMQITHPSYAYARLWFARGMSTCLVSALLCVTLALAIVGPRLPPHPAAHRHTAPCQMKEERVIHIITQHIILQDRGAAAGSNLGRIVLRSQNINLFHFAWYTESIHFHIFHTLQMCYFLENNIHPEFFTIHFPLKHVFSLLTVVTQGLRF